MIRSQPGVELPALHKGTLATSHIVRWCAAQRNWDKMHYDAAFAREYAGLPGLLINGALKQHFIVQFLESAFEHRGWVWRIDYRFTDPDIVGQSLGVRGAIKEVFERGEFRFVVVEATIFNDDLQKATTIADAVVVLHGSGKPLTELPTFDELPSEHRLPERVETVDSDVPKNVARRIGETLQSVKSICPVERTRLLLFADAVGNLPAWYYDSKAAAESPHGRVVAPPLYPIHGLEVAPGTHRLSAEPAAIGREGVSEIGRNLGELLDLGFRRFVNGGNKVEIFSLAGVGESINADSKLVSARVKKGRRTDSLLIVETYNRYFADSGRPLLAERQTFIYR